VNGAGPHHLAIGDGLDRRLRVRAEWARSRNGAARGVLSKDPIRRDTLLDPVHQRIEQVLWLWPVASSTMPDARGAEQAIEVLIALVVIALWIGCADNRSQSNQNSG